MAIIENSVVIRRPREAVFDALSDPRGELEWNPKVEVMEKTDDGPVGLGSTFRAKWKLSKPLTLTVTRYDRPVRCSFHNDGPIEVDLDADFDEHPDGTLLRTRFNARPHGSAWLFFPVFLVMIRREERENMGHLKRWLESAEQAARRSSSRTRP